MNLDTPDTITNKRERILWNDLRELYEGFIRDRVEDDSREQVPDAGTKAQFADVTDRFQRKLMAKE